MTNSEIFLVCYAVIGSIISTIITGYYAIRAFHYHKISFLDRYWDICSLLLFASLIGWPIVLIIYAIRFWRMITKDIPEAISMFQ